MPPNSYLALAALAVVLAGCGTASATPTAVAAPTQTASATSSPVAVVARSAPTMRFLSEPQAGITPWLAAIHQAHHRIEINDYLLTDQPLIQALRQAAGRGVTVQVMIDGQPYGDRSAAGTTRSAFAGSSVQVKLAPTRFEGAYHYDHAKYLVVDPGTLHELAILGSPNGTASAFDGSNLEDAVETSNPATVEALNMVFTADWQNRPTGVVPRLALVLSPGAQPQLLTLVAPPGPIAVMTEELGSASALYAALMVPRSTARVLVPATLSVEDRRHAAALAATGVQVRTLQSPYVHAKLIVTASRTFIGSQNFSVVSFNDNREVGLITTSRAIHAEALAWFNAAWSRATPWDQKAPNSGKGPPSHVWPYIPADATMAQVRHLWGNPQTVSHDIYRGTSETVWHYAGGAVYFEHSRVHDVRRS